LAAATLKARGETLKVGFPASNFSSFIARAIRSLRVDLAFRRLLGFVVRETLERVFLFRFKGRFFFGIRCYMAVLSK
jgi:hypothetical protein